MANFYKLCYLCLCLSLLLSSVLLSSVGRADDGLLPSPGKKPSSAVARLRIPSGIVLDGINRDFQNTRAVDREVLGTRSRGSALCVGKVTCALIDNPNGAEFECLISGTVTSTTCGVNGPATIQSSTRSEYTARKRLFFDGRQIATAPAEVKVSTQLAINDVGSSLPRLRGRLVRRVASRRAAESRAEAEAITANLTHDDLQQQIDAEFEHRIALLNHQLDKRLAVVALLSKLGAQFTVRTLSDSIVLDLYHDASPSSKSFPAESLAGGDSVELWLPKAESREPASATAEALLSAMPAWLAPYIEEHRDLADFLKAQELNMRRAEDWLILELRE